MTPEKNEQFSGLIGRYALQERMTVHAIYSGERATEERYRERAERARTKLLDAIGEYAEPQRPTIHPDTLRYGLMDATSKAVAAIRDPGADAPVMDWEEWQKKFNDVEDAMTREQWGVFESILLTIPAGAPRDTFVSVMADHINQKTWG